MVLYTCAQKTSFGSLGHPCGKAGKALSEAGHEFEVRAVPGYKNVPFANRDLEGKRPEVVELSGQAGVPILKLDDGEVITGSGEIVKWAEEHPAPAA